MKGYSVLFSFFALMSVFLTVGCGRGEGELRKFIREKSSQLSRLETRLNLAEWEAATSGTEEAYKKLQEAKDRYTVFLANSKDFKFLKSWLLKKDKIKDPLLRRELEILYNYYLPNQVNPELMRKINGLETEIARKFATYRAKIDGKEYSLNDIEEVLKNSRDEELRRKAWEGQKGVGRIVEAPLKELVKLRNKLGRSLGFKNYYEMRLAATEMTPEQLFRILDRVAELTDEPFRRLKARIDGEIAARRGKRPEELMPWDYEDPFFQEAPAVFQVNLDRFYRGRDVVKIALDYYDSVGLDLHDVIERSDLFERPGKSPHAFAIDINRAGDVRILLNIKDNEFWMISALHELGHAAYSKYVDKTDLPYLLRTEAHMFTTEAVAMFFEDMTRNPHWMVEMLGVKREEIEPYIQAMKEYLSAKALIFARWDMVMTHFERDMYENPYQNLNALWWIYKKRYQNLRRPRGRNEPDWAAKIHIALYPVYYHNYMLGELLACQFHRYIIRHIYGGRRDVSFAHEPRIGRFFVEEVFSQGAKYRWDEMIRRATGEPLKVDYFVERFFR